jgi:hypothetical protein
VGAGCGMGAGLGGGAPGEHGVLGGVFMDVELPVVGGDELGLVDDAEHADFGAACGGGFDSGLGLVGQNFSRQQGAVVGGVGDVNDFFGFLGVGPEEDSLPAGQAQEEVEGFFELSQIGTKYRILCLFKLQSLLERRGNLTGYPPFPSPVYRISALDLRSVSDFII